MDEFEAPGPEDEQVIDEQTAQRRENLFEAPENELSASNAPQSGAAQTDLTHGDSAPGELLPNEASQAEPAEQIDADDLLVAEAVADSPHLAETSVVLKAVIEAAIYVTDEPLTAEQIAAATEQPLEEVKAILSQLMQEYAAPERGLSVREIAGGYKMATKPEYHEAIRRFVKRLQPPLKLSLAALETLAVIAYKQPITGPEILEIRGVQGAGVVKTLLDRKLIVTAGRKNVLGKPMLYKTSRDFLVQFGLNSLTELPTLKEFEELGRMALSDAEEDSALLAANPNGTESVPSQDETRESSEESVETEQEADA